MADDPCATAPCPSCANRGWNLRDARIVPCDCGVYDPPAWVRRGDRPCLVPHGQDVDRPRRAHVGNVCAGHHAKLERLLAELPALYDDLALQLTASSPSGGDESHTKNSLTSAGVSLNEPVTQIRQDIRNGCVALARNVSESNLDEDGNHDPLPTVDAVPVLARWLFARIVWMCGQLDIDETFAFLNELTQEAKRRAYPPVRHRLPIGPCGGAECPGILWLAGESDEGRSMSCDDCGRVVEPRYWRRERRRIDGVDVNPWLTLSEAAVAYGASTRTVERWVKAGRLKSRGRPARVKASSVEALMQAMVGKCA